MASLLSQQSVSAAGLACHEGGLSGATGAAWWRRHPMIIVVRLVYAWLAHTGRCRRPLAECTPMDTSLLLAAALRTGPGVTPRLLHCLSLPAITSATVADVAAPQTPRTFHAVHIRVSQSQSQRSHSTVTVVLVIIQNIANIPVQYFSDRLVLKSLSMFFVNFHFVETGILCSISHVVPVMENCVLI